VNIKFVLSLKSSYAFDNCAVNKTYVLKCLPIPKVPAQLKKNLRHAGSLTQNKSYLPKQDRLKIQLVF
jgi:hypothetical protein